jgi:hypothetical protein
MKIKTCLHCQQEFNPKCHNVIFCSKQCKKNYNQKLKLENSLKKYPDGCDENSFVGCVICGFRSTDLISHVRNHKLTPLEYKEKFKSEVKCQNTKDNIKGDKNPAYQHGGKFSPFSKNFIHYKGDEYIEDLFIKSILTRKENGNQVNTIEYYTNRGFTEDEARKIMYETFTFSLENCKRRHGEEEGLRIFNERQEKWQATLNSKSQEELDDMNRRKDSGSLCWALKKCNGNLEEAEILVENTNKKRTLLSFSNLYHGEIDSIGYFYIIKLDTNKFKIGITTKDNILQRYSHKDLKNKEVIMFNKVDTINHAFQIEQLLKSKYKNHIKKDDYGPFGWTEVLNDINEDSVVAESKKLLHDPTGTLYLFEQEFKKDHNKWN